MPEYQRSPFLQNVLETAQIFKSGAEQEKERKLAKEMARSSFMNKMALEGQQQQFELSKSQQEQEAKDRTERFKSKLGLLGKLAKDSSYDPESKKSVFNAMTSLISGSEDVPLDLGKLQERTVTVPKQYRDAFGEDLVPETVPEWQWKALQEAYKTIQEGKVSQARAGYFNRRADGTKPEMETVEVEGVGKVPIKHYGSVMGARKGQTEAELNRIDTEMKQIEWQHSQVASVLDEVLKSDDPEETAKQLGTTTEALMMELKTLEQQRGELQEQYRTARVSASRGGGGKQDTEKKKIDWVR